MVIYRVQRVLNGIAVYTTTSQVAALRRLPGVTAIRPMTPKYRSNATSVPLIGAPQVWNASQGIKATGTGVKIGIIDTGIDYLHTDFGGPGTGYATNDTTKVEPGGGFPSAKVAGGKDFAGDNYDADDVNNNTPAPDPDPMDCDGHGWHVAGTAAGYGVNANGTTYKGVYGPATPSAHSGSALASLRMPSSTRCACLAGGNDEKSVKSAIEWAVDPNGEASLRITSTSSICRWLGLWR